MYFFETLSPLSKTTHSMSIKSDLSHTTNPHPSILLPFPPLSFKGKQGPHLGLVLKCIAISNRTFSPIPFGTFTLASLPSSPSSFACIISSIVSLNSSVGFAPNKWCTARVRTHQSEEQSKRAYTREDLGIIIRPKVVEESRAIGPNRGVGKS